MTEAEFQRQVIQLAELNHWKVGHFHDSRRQVKPGVFVGDRAAAGFPDLVLVRERVVFAELKTRVGKVSISQRLWLDALKAAGCEVHVWRPQDLQGIAQVLGRSGGLRSRVA